MSGFGGIHRLIPDLMKLVLYVAIIVVIGYLSWSYS